MTKLSLIDVSSWVSCNPKDVKQFNEEQRRIGEEWDEAMSKFGFAIIIGHGIDEDIFSTLLEEAEAFFCRSLNSKMQYNNGDYGHPLGGYTPPGYEKVGLSTGEVDADLKNTKGTKQPSQNTPSNSDIPSSSAIKFDPVENFVFTTSPSSFSSVRNSSIVCPFPSANAYYHKMNTLLTTLHQLSASSLHLKDINYFENFYNSSYWPGKEDQMGKNGNVLRITHYPGQSAEILAGNYNKSTSTEGSFFVCSVICNFLSFFFLSWKVCMIERYVTELILIIKALQFLNLIKPIGIQ
jgi:isopenicillin N synthase-like dioxygenase